MARKLKSDKLLFTATLLLVCASVVMVYSASAVIGAGAVPPARTCSCSSRRRGRSLGLALMPLVMRDRLPPLPAAGRDLDGARRWSRSRWSPCCSGRASTARAAGSASAGIGVQPSEFAKIAVIFFVAALLERRMDRIDDVRYSLLPDRRSSLGGRGRR